MPIQTDTQQLRSGSYIYHHTFHMFKERGTKAEP